MRVDFATFCYSGDAHKLHAPGQLKKQIESNNYPFDRVLIIHQLCNPKEYENPEFTDSGFNIRNLIVSDIDSILLAYGLDLEGQYKSDTDNKHWWKHHVVNHLIAARMSDSDYIVFADADCWMTEQPEDESWVMFGIAKLERYPEIFIVSPNDGEVERTTRRMSQQMFLARTHEFENADFNQPGWDGNTNIPGGPMPEYWGMLEGRMELYCQQSHQYRYVCPPKYRYWHHQW